MKKLQTLYSRLTNRFKYWVLMVVASAVIVGFAYVAVQQNYRENANDPQVQYAQDISAALEQGASPEQLGGNSPVDPRKSLGLFLMVMDENKKVLASSMQLDGNPVPANGNFDAAKKGQERFTWKPQKDTRIAAVMQHYKGQKPGFILVGRSLKEVEKREQQLMLMAVASFLALLALSTVAVRIGAAPRKPRKAAAETQAPLQFENEPGAAEAMPADVDEEALPVKEPSAPKKRTSKPKAKKSSKKSSRS